MVQTLSERKVQAICLSPYSDSEDCDTLGNLKALSYRLVYHELADSVSHLDLFILTDGNDSLFTYELDIKYETELKKQKNFLALPVDSLAISLVSRKERENSSLWKAIRKPDHQLIYWNYSGPISRGRGIIWEISRGKIFCNLPYLTTIF